MNLHPTGCMKWPKYPPTKIQFSKSTILSTCLFNHTLFILYSSLFNFIRSIVRHLLNQNTSFTLMCTVCNSLFYSFNCEASPSTLRFILMLFSLSSSFHSEDIATLLFTAFRALLCSHYSCCVSLNYKAFSSHCTYLSCLIFIMLCTSLHVSNLVGHASLCHP